MDAGNFAANRDFEPLEKTEFIWDMMSEMGYDVVTPGDFELLQGLEGMKALYGKHPEIQIVSANVLDKQGSPVFPEYTMIEKQGVKFGVTGVTGPSFYSFNLTRGTQKSDDFTFEDSKEALQRVVPNLRREADVVVVLLHEGPGDARRLVDDIEGMDVVVVGHNPGYMFNPDRVGSTLLLRPGNRGQYLSVLELTLDEGNGEIVDYNGEGKPLNEDVQVDPELGPVVTQFDKEWNDRKRAQNRKNAAKAALLQGTEKYVGAEACARCHVEEYTRWSQTPHARAFATLEKTEQQGVKECLSCHVVGFQEPTGYHANRQYDKDGLVLTSSDDLKLRNVQCESCHGMGTLHGTEAMVKIPSEETCRTCHSGEFEKGFDYASALASGMIH